MTRIMLIVLCHVFFTLCDSDLLITTESDELCTIGCECPPFGMYSYLICSQKNISNLPDNIQFRKEIIEITFRGNNIENVSKNMFSYTPYLEELDLSQNSLKYIEDDSFMRLTGLQVLHLSNNDLATISSQLLYGLRNLELLELGHNRLTTLPRALFEPVPGLKELKLQSNRLNTFDDDSFRYLTLLEKLDLENNGFTTLSPDLFQYTPQLHWLSLADNELKIFPGRTFRQTRMLKSLDLSGNKFVTLQSQSFSSLFNLSSLYLNNLNELMKIENDVFFNMSSLKLISCNYNQKLRFIHPEAFKRFQNSADGRYTTRIEKIFLGHNNLKSLDEPADIDTWMKTDSVDLGNNPWHCDCKLRWMTKLKHEISSTVRCSSPLFHHGRMVSHMKEQDFVCDSHWAFSTLVMVMASLVLFVFSLAFAIMMACRKTRVGKYVRARNQFSYAMVDPRKEIDLEWDPSAEMMK